MVCVVPFLNASFLMVQSICLGHQSDINAKTRDRDKYALLLLNNP